MGLMTLPVVMANARQSRSSFGEIMFLRAKSSMMGVPMMARVSFMRTADPIPMVKRMASTSASTDFARPNSLWQMWVRYPESSIACPMINMPKRKKMTSK